MKITNEMIANQFNELADLLEIQGANPFRIRAYRTAARNIVSLGRPINEIIKEGEKLTDIPGIGKDLAEKIKEIAKNGSLSLLKQTEKTLPKQLTELMKLSGLGPKRVKMLHEKLNVKNLMDLKKAMADGRLKKLRGFGDQLIKKIETATRHEEEFKKAAKLCDVWPVANELFAHLSTLESITKVLVAGSFRRHKETVGDLDVLVAAHNKKAAIKKFLEFDAIDRITAQGMTRAAVILKSGLQVDLRVVPKVSFGAALLYFTGSKAHNIALRQISLNKKMKLNEYGLFKGKSLKAAKTESEVYRALGLPYIEPELRENRGEIEAALKKELPHLIELTDIRGDLHIHTKETDGMDTLEKMAKTAQNLGYAYIAITDHSKRLTVAQGLTEKRLLKQLEIIDKLNSKMRGFTILKSLEVDILEDGSLDLSNDVLRELDLTVCSIHSHFNLSSSKQTDRIIRAMDNKFFNILGHPTGRLVNRRMAYQVDLVSIMKAAHLRGCFFELNAQPERLDLNDIHCRMAKEMGLKLAISTDAHNMQQLDYMKFGVFQARRGWIEKSDIINTQSLRGLKKLFKR